MTTDTATHPSRAATSPAPSTWTTGPAIEALRHWRLLLLWALFSLLPAVLLALPLWRLLGASFDYSVQAPALASELDLVAIGDIVNNYTRSGASVPLVALQALVLTLLLSPLLTGMALSAARAPERPGFGALLAGGCREYLRMARMLVVAVLPLGAAVLLGGAARGAADRYGEASTSVSDAASAGMAATIVMALLLLLAHASIDAGRAVLALDRRRGSAFKAWWQGLRMLLRRPLAVLGAYLPITIVGLLLAAALTLGRVHLPRADGAGVIAAFVLTQLIVLVLAWMRTARLFALIGVARR